MKIECREKEMVREFNLSRIIAQSNKQYSQEELRKCIPFQESEPREGSKYIRENCRTEFSLPFAESCPIEICLSKFNRELLESGSIQGSRNNCGAKLARDLIGISLYLTKIGQSFKGDPEHLFQSFCDRCTPPIDKDESNAIWKSAMKSAPEPCLSPKKVERCIRSWIRRRLDKDSSDRSIEYSGDKRLRSSKKLLSSEQLREKLLAYEQIEDLYDRNIELLSLSRESGYHKRDLLELLQSTKLGIDSDDSKWAISAKAFASKDLGSSDWLLKELIPANRILLLAADAKTGKSLLAYDWAYCFATGQDWGEIACQKRRNVILVQTDESEVDCQERIKVRGLSELDNVRIISKFSPDCLPRLKRVATSHNVDVIIVDSLTSIQRYSRHSPKDPEYGYWLYDLKDFAANSQISIILISHTNKSPIEVGLGKIAGSYSITAAVSEIFMLIRPKTPVNDLQRVLIRAGSRIASQQSWLIELNLEDYSYNYLYPCDRTGAALLQDTFIPNKEVSAKENIKGLLLSCQEHALLANEIAERLNLSKNTIRKLCCEMFKEEILEREKSKQGKGWSYSPHPAYLKSVSSNVKP